MAPADHLRDHLHLPSQPQESPDAAFLQALQLCTLGCVPMAVRAALTLNVFESLAAADANSALSAVDIVGHIATSNPEAQTSLDRILRVIASHSILSSSLEPGSAHGELVRKYRLNPLSSCICQSQSKESLAALLFLNTDVNVISKPWAQLHERVLGKPELSLGMDDDPEKASLFVSAITKERKALALRLVDTYDGFRGLNSLVDVGGGTSSCLSEIVAKHPHIRGMNFDFPQMLAASPTHPGVENVEGDMFESVPQADAVLMELILHNLADEQCTKVLKNCFEALPENGKVIVVDTILPAEVETGLRARVGYQMDVIMLAFSQGGKERTEDELKRLVTSAGFSGMRVMCTANELSIVEVYKRPQS